MWKTVSLVPRLSPLRSGESLGTRLENCKIMNCCSLETAQLFVTCSGGQCYFIEAHYPCSKAVQGTEVSGGLEFPPATIPPTPLPSHNFLPPEILKLNMVIIVVSSILAIQFYWTQACFIKIFLGKFVPDYVRNNLRGSKFKIFLERHASRHP